jgi:hypothetical protein
VDDYLTRKGKGSRGVVSVGRSLVDFAAESRLEGGVNRAKLKITKLITTTSRVSVRNIIESAREDAKQIASE